MMDLTREAAELGYARTALLGYALLACAVLGLMGGLAYAAVRPHTTYRKAPVSHTHTVWRGRPAVDGAEVYDGD